MKYGKKRYFLFEITHYYPAGGMNDCILKTNDVEEALSVIRHKHAEDPYSMTNYEIYDVETDEIIIELCKNSGSSKFIDRRKVKDGK
jgi:hypothetical protein